MDPAVVAEISVHDIPRVGERRFLDDEGASLPLPTGAPPASSS